MQAVACTFPGGTHRSFWPPKDGQLLMNGENSAHHSCQHMERKRKNKIIGREKEKKEKSCKGGILNPWAVAHYGGCGRFRTKLCERRAGVQACMQINLQSSSVYMCMCAGLPLAWVELRMLARYSHGPVPLCSRSQATKPQRLSPASVKHSVNLK